MTYVDLQGQSEAVREFVMSLAHDQGGAVLELNGQAVACVVPVPAANGDAVREWTDELNNRRCDLIDKEIDGTLSAAEAVELQHLQRAMLQYRNRVAPLPIDAVRQLHQQLLAKAAQQSIGP